MPRRKQRTREYNLVLPGLQVNGWHVIDYAPDNRHGAKMVLCRCAICGSERAVVRNDVAAGFSKNCGCVNKARFTEDRHLHGAAPQGAKSQGYKTWLWLKRRYKDAVDPSWAASFEAFVRDLPPRPSPAHRIHVIDKTLPVNAANVEWRVKRETTIGKNIRRARVRVQQAEARRLADA